MRVSLEQANNLFGELKYQAYGALDATGTREIFDHLYPRLSERQQLMYDWSRAQLGPALTMTRRGILVDQLARSEAIQVAQGEFRTAENDIRRIDLVKESWDGTELETGKCSKQDPPKLGKKGQLLKNQPTATPNHKWPEDWPTNKSAVCERCNARRYKPSPFKPTSPAQVGRLLYDILRVPVRTGKDSERTTNKDALESIRNDPRAIRVQGTGREVLSELPGLYELADAILRIKDFHKQIQTLKAPLSNMGRFHSTFNVGTPWTGRWSSSADPFDRGGNAQNITERFRHCFVADPGYKMAYADLKTAESLLVANMAGDENYIEAHKGDVHTYVCRLLWPELPWTGDIWEDKNIAKKELPPWDNVAGHDYRFQSKRVQHGTNYGLTAFGIAIIAHIPLAVARAAQSAYFEAFPQIRAWHRWVRKQVEEQMEIIGPLGRGVHLFGRPWDEHTFKQALAYGPQGGVGDILNLGMWRIWKRYDPHMVQLLAQVHDAILLQFPEKEESDIVPRLVEAMRVTTHITDFNGVQRQCEIPVEIATGWNWGKRNTKAERGRLNPRGLEELVI